MKILTRLTPTVLIVWCLGMLAFGCSVFVHWPLAQKAAFLSEQIVRGENCAVLVRQTLALRDDSVWQARLRPTSEVPVILNDILNQAKAHRVAVVSLEPGRPLEEEGVQEVVLPLTLDLKASYRDIALFFGALERSQMSVIRVKKFLIDYSGDKTYPLRVRLLLEVYLRHG